MPQQTQQTCLSFLSVTRMTAGKQGLVALMVFWGALLLQAGRTSIAFDDNAALPSPCLPLALSLPSPLGLGAQGRCDSHKAGPHSTLLQTCDTSGTEQ